MARKKKSENEITGLTTNPDDKLTIMKSNPLLSLWRSDMRLSEFKILDLYLSRINSHEPDKRTVIFKRGELESVLGVSQIRREDLDNRLDRLMRSVPIEVSPGDIGRVSLFEWAYAHQDGNGMWEIRMSCTPAAMQYIFNVEELGYLRYKLRSVKALTSRYSYILFLYLEQNRWRKTWEIPVDELRALLACDSDPSYAEFKRFNDLILKKCRRELTEKTDCRFSYETVKAGKKVKAIRFTLETLADVLPDPGTRRPELPGQVDLFTDSGEDFMDYTEIPVEDDNTLYADALPPEFTPEEVEALRSLAAPIVPHKYNSMVPPECEVADYLRHKTDLMAAMDKKGKIQNKFRYLLAMIQKDVDEQNAQN